MDSQAVFGIKELFTHLVGDMAKAVSERNGETKQQQFVRSNAAVHTIMGFQPRDAIEAMLAGHCLMFHELITDTMRNTLMGELDTQRRATRSGIVAMDKAFGTNLQRLERYQTRPSEGRSDVPDAKPAARPAEIPRPVKPVTVPVAAWPVALPIQTPAPAAAVRVPSPAPAAVLVSTPAPAAVVQVPALAANGASRAPYRPSVEAVDACRANPAAMAALDAGDADAFARAMGVEPSDAYLAAAAGPNGVFAGNGPASREIPTAADHGQNPTRQA